MRTCTSLVITWSLLMGFADAQMREWKDDSGQYSVQAELLVLTSDNVVQLKRPDGTTMEIPMDKLSPADRQFACQANRLPAAGEPFQIVGLDSGPPETEAIKADAESQVVVAEGVGLSAQDALKDAFRQAVRQVVGTYVDAETLVQNDELVDDKVLTYSGGYVKAFKRISDKQQGGLFRVSIQAAVKRQQLVQKLKDENVTVREVEGQILFAEAVSKMQEEKDADALLKEALEGFPENVIRAEIIGQPDIVGQTGEVVSIKYDVKIAVDLDKYEAFQKRLTGVLDQVASRKAEVFLVSRSDPNDVKYALQNLNQFMYEASDADMKQVFLATETKLFRYENPHSISTQGQSGGFPWDWYKTNPELDAKSEIVVVVNTTRTSLHDRTGWRWYHVKRKAVGLSAEQTQPCDGDDYLAALAGRVKVDIVFLDGESNETSRDRFSLTRVPGSTLRSQVVLLGAYNRHVPEWFISPYVLPGTAYSRSVTITRAMDISLEDLKAVKSVKCTVSGL